MKFYKYNALGNDFIFIEGRSPFESEVLARMCKENEIGADGVVFIAPHQNYDSILEIYNKDGSSAVICGNALRALAYHLREQKGIARERFEVLVGSSVYAIGVDVDGCYAEFPDPEILAETEESALVKSGNLHLIRKVRRLDISRLYEEGTMIRGLFNIHELMVIDRKTCAFISYERGVGLTDSCVSGAVSAYRLLSGQNPELGPVTFKTLGGDLHLSGSAPLSVRASGAVRLVYVGECDEKVFLG